jgi:hypothetical protein
MDRMNESPLPAARRDRDEDGFFDVSPAAVDHCENCGRSGQRLTRVPEFDYMGCDDCMEEALAVIDPNDEGQDPIGWEGGFAANH